MSRFCACSIFGTLFLAVLGVSGTQAQQATVLEAGSCPACTIQLSRIVALGDSSGGGAVGTVGALARDRTGNFYAASWEIVGEIAVFDRTGRFLRTIGRPGGGPGEFGGINQILTENGRLHVLDESRWTVLDSAFRVSRVITLPAFPRQVLLMPDGLLLNAEFRTPDLFGFPLHYVKSDGTRTLSFGADSSTYRSDILYAGHRVLARCPGSGDIWTSQRTRYELVRWDDDGERTQTLTRQVQWFTPHLRAPTYQPSDGAPPPIVAAIQCDSAGRIWVLIHVADRDWRSGLRAGSALHPGMFQPTDFAAYFDTVIEVIDPRAGHVIATRRVDDFLAAFVDEGHVLRHPRQQSYPRFDVWRINVIQDGRL
jgi:hypothetical protein